MDNLMSPYRYLLSCVCVPAGMIHLTETPWTGLITKLGPSGFPSHRQLIQPAFHVGYSLEYMTRGCLNEHDTSIFVPVFSKCEMAEADVNETPQGSYPWQGHTKQSHVVQAEAPGVQGSVVYKERILYEYFNQHIYSI